MRFRKPPPEPVENPDEADRQESRRLTMVTRSFQQSGTGRQAYIITLESGKEIVLILPTNIAKEVGKQGGWIGRIRPARDEDNIQVANLSPRQQEIMSSKKAPDAVE